MNVKRVHDRSLRFHYIMNKRRVHDLSLRSHDCKQACIMFSTLSLYHEQKACS